MRETAIDRMKSKVYKGMKIKLFNEAIQVKGKSKTKNEQKEIKYKYKCFRFAKKRKIKDIYASLN